MNIAIILGTRPEIIKMSPVIKELDIRGIDYFVLHTGQHYDYLMDKIFFKELNLEPETINLKVGSGSHSETTSKMMIGIEKILLDEKPDIVLVLGDTNTVLAGALVSIKLHIELGHIEAGLRSYDRRMPEEYNRIICDHIADYLFAPTKLTERILKEEGISRKDILYNKKRAVPQIILTGNTIVDAIQQNLVKANASKIITKLGLTKENYFLATAHREEHVDHKESLSGILEGFESLTDTYNLPIIYPIHPRTKKRLEEFGLIDKINKIEKLKLIEPVGFFDLLALESNAKLILTDSGGVQEEACSLRVPCVFLGERSDRSESVQVGAAMLAECDSQKIMNATQAMIKKERNWSNPFGNGTSARKIIDVILKNV